MPLDVLGGSRKGDGAARLLLLLLLVTMTVAELLLLSFRDFDGDAGGLSTLVLEPTSLLLSDTLELSVSTKPKVTRLESGRETSSQSRSCNPTNLGHALRRSASGELKK